MPRAPRASHPEQKAERSAAILGTALALFRVQGYAALTMAQVAQAAGLAKGTVYLSFPSKESLFLDLLEARYGAWFETVEAGLPAGSTPMSLARHLSKTLLDTPDFLSLLVLGPTVLEHNVDEARALRYKCFLLDRSLRLSALLEAQVGLRPGQGMTLLIRLHALALGLHPHAVPAPVVAALLEHPDLAPFRVDFAAVLEACLTDLLRGMEH